ncbi:hypothetical protein NP233_g12551 [Leucocoprinus birnbaumii]|uniref:Uncharacterized protein n=1 Tax=Leucocoprinus birnbaumii TaxID=56174 RepID=A0AAD5YKC3_9AGAR|nr:hypothetical protein NP233_g12551 [Leucocoprinus birnbaumii]
MKDSDTATHYHLMSPSVQASVAGRGKNATRGTTNFALDVSGPLSLESNYALQADWERWDLHQTLPGWPGNNRGSLLLDAPGGLVATQTIIADNNSRANGLPSASEEYPQRCVHCEECSTLRIARSGTDDVVIMKFIALHFVDPVNLRPRECEEILEHTLHEYPDCDEEWLYHQFRDFLHLQLSASHPDPGTREDRKFERYTPHDVRILLCRCIESIQRRLRSGGQSKKSMASVFRDIMESSEELKSARRGSATSLVDKVRKYYQAFHDALVDAYKGPGQAGAEAT